MSPSEINLMLLFSLESMATNHRNHWCRLVVASHAGCCCSMVCWKLAAVACTIQRRHFKTHNPGFNLSFIAGAVVDVDKATQQSQQLTKMTPLLLTTSARPYIACSCYFSYHISESALACSSTGLHSRYKSAAVSSAAGVTGK